MSIIDLNNISESRVIIPDRKSKKEVKHLDDLKWYLINEFKIHFKIVGVVVIYAIPIMYLIWIVLNLKLFGKDIIGTKELTFFNRIIEDITKVLFGFFGSKFIVNSTKNES